MPKRFLPVALVAAFLLANAQAGLPTPGPKMQENPAKQEKPAAEEKTVQFDNSSTATLVLQVHGEGVQIYACVKDADWVWKLKAPDATLFDEQHHAIGKHFAGPTWRLDDGSEVHGKLLESRQQPGTIPWLILSAESTGSEGRLSHVDAVRRSDTQGGLAPETGCDEQHADAEVRVPYSATYAFFDRKK
jgi:Protein of unknown function (DUF3455)